MGTVYRKRTFDQDVGGRRARKTPPGKRKSASMTRRKPHLRCLLDGKYQTNVRLRAIHKGVHSTLSEGRKALTLFDSEEIAGWSSLRSRFLSSVESHNSALVHTVMRLCSGSRELSANVQDVFWSRRHCFVSVVLCGPFQYDYRGCCPISVSLINQNHRRPPAGVHKTHVGAPLPG